ncbi:MAG: hypothetical protein ABI072_05440 [Edaphobacter sp.]
MTMWELWNVGRMGTKSRFAAVSLCWALMVLFGGRIAMAGPPFQTDDPDPVPFQHFEMYAFGLSSSASDGTTLAFPSYELNYGVAPNVQLHLVVPVVASLPSDGASHYGIGDTELGAKIRLVKETKLLPEVGIFPFIELPSGDAAKGLGVGAAWYRLPLWIQKSWGKWTSYGGGGETLVPVEGEKNFPFAGLLVQREVNKKLTLGSELFGHGAMSEGAGSSTLLDAGGFYEIKEGFDLLFAGGHSIAGQAETYAYLALYWTWGPKGKGSDDAGGGKSGLMAMLAKMRLR